MHLLTKKTMHLYFRTVVPQLPASPIFSLQINPSPDSNTLAKNPIMMMFDVVSQYIIRTFATFMHLTLLCIIGSQYCFVKVRAKWCSK